MVSFQSWAFLAKIDFCDGLLKTGGVTTEIVRYAVSAWSKWQSPWAPRRFAQAADGAGAADHEGAQRHRSVVLLSTIVTTAEAPLELRVQAAGMLAPYTHSRCTARYIRKKIDLPVVETERRLIANAGGELTPIAASHPEDKEQLAASDQGELPNELLQKVPVEPGNYPLGLDDARRRAAGTRPIKRAPMNYSQVAISLNEA